MSPRNKPAQASQIGPVPLPPRPSSDLIQWALDWLFEQDEAIEYDRRKAAEQAVAGKQA